MLAQLCQLTTHLRVWSAVHVSLVAVFQIRQLLFCCQANAVQKAIFLAMAVSFGGKRALK